MTIQTRRNDSATRTRTVPTIALAVALLGFLTPGTASAATGQVCWTPAPVPPVSGVLFNAIQLDTHTTWAYGVALSPGVGPLLMTRNDHDGPGWTAMPTDALGEHNRINAVSAASPHDAWLVGDLSRTAGSIVTAHWDGTSMRTVNAPVPANAVGAGLLAVSAHAADDVWATGWAEILDSSEPDPNKPGGTIQVTHNEALLEHWDGRGWQLTAVPGGREMVLQSVSARSRTDVWAAGYTGADQPALLHFDGQVWAAAPSLTYAGVNGEIQALTANGPDDIWAVGRAVLDPDDLGHALVAHWDGHRWRQVPAPSDAGALSSVVTVPGGIAITGSTVDEMDGYTARLTGTHWQSLGIPIDGVTHLLTVGLSWSGGRLTAVGERVSDESPLPLPLVLTAALSSTG